MASTVSAQETATVHRRLFFCHRCSNRWMKSHDSEFVCPHCRQGFIEEVADNTQPPAIDTNSNPMNSESFASFFPYIFSSGASSTSGRRSRPRPRYETTVPHTSRSRSPRSRNPSVSVILSSLYGGVPSLYGGVPSSDRNFEIQSGGRTEIRAILGLELDELVDSLFAAQRPSPISQSVLNELPKATITDVETLKQCAICFEDFKLAEVDIRKLPCNHMFHEKCIFPWLRTSATCAVCRYDLNGNNSSPASNASTQAGTSTNVTDTSASSRSPRGLVFRRRRNNNAQISTIGAFFDFVGRVRGQDAAEQAGNQGRATTTSTDVDNDNRPTRTTRSQILRASTTISNPLALDDAEGPPYYYLRDRNANRRTAATTRRALHIAEPQQHFDLTSSDSEQTQSPISVNALSRSSSSSSSSSTSTSSTSSSSVIRVGGNDEPIPDDQNPIPPPPNAFVRTIHQLRTAQRRVQPRAAQRRAQPMDTSSDEE